MSRQGGSVTFGRWSAATTLAVVATLLPTATAHAASGTDVCGQLPSGTTTWTAAGSPYRICGAGLTVPADATLALDAIAGRVEVTGQGGAYLQVYGALDTRNTSPIARVSITSSLITGGSPSAVVQLDGADVSDTLINNVFVSDFSFTNSSTNRGLDVTATTATIS